MGVKTDVTCENMCLINCGSGGLVIMGSVTWECSSLCCASPWFSLSLSDKEEIISQHTHGNVKASGGFHRKGGCRPKVIKGA
jgi:hypothetical protein